MPGSVEKAQRVFSVMDTSGSRSGAGIYANEVHDRTGARGAMSQRDAGHRDQFDAGPIRNLRMIDSDDEEKMPIPT
jgi:hypothetical protein